jgi:ferrous iron transport protein B
MSEATAFLIGLPNAGKSTLFNALTGKSRKVSNYSGITTDIAQSTIPGLSLQVIDLPGVSSLSPLSPDEAVTINCLFNCHLGFDANIIFFVLDLQRLTPSISLCLEVLEQFPGQVIALVNKDDDMAIGSQQQTHYQEKLGCPVVPLSSLNQSPEELKQIVSKLIQTNEGKIKPLRPLSSQLISKTSLPFLDALTDKEGRPIFLVESDENQVFNDLLSKTYKAREIVTAGLAKERKAYSHKIDKVILNNWLGPIIFFSIFLFIFTALFSWASPLMDGIDALVSLFGSFLSPLITHPLLNSLFIDGIIGGVGGVVIFLPQIMILFFLLSLLEQSGYIARASLITDKVMSFFGLSGKSFLPFLSGFACSIPGIMAARTIADKKERLATMVTLPLITCSARLPVYILIVGTFIPERTIFGIFNLQGLSFFFLYFLGPISALIMAKVFRLSLFKGESSSFVMDLPDYQKPRILSALKHSVQKGLGFLKKAGSIILLLSLAIWLLSTFPQTDQSKTANLTETQSKALALENSALGRIGKVIEPALRPIGLDWKMGVGLLISLGARELFVSALGTIYALGDVDEESNGLKQRILNEKDHLGRKKYDLATAWSILLFFVFSLQCTSTLAILKKETGSWKVPAYTFAYLFLLAYAASFAAYNGLKLL